MTKRRVRLNSFKLDEILLISRYKIVISRYKIVISSYKGRHFQLYKKPDVTPEIYLEDHKETRCHPRVCLKKQHPRYISGGPKRNQMSPQRSIWRTKTKRNQTSPQRSAWRTKKKPDVTPEIYLEDQKESRRHPRDLPGGPKRNQTSPQRSTWLED